MRVLLAVDGSEYGEAAGEELIRRHWPSGTDVRVVSVAEVVSLVTDPVLVLAASHVESLKEQRGRASRNVAKTADEIAKKAPSLRISTQVLEGSPKKEIAAEAEHWGADIVLLGSHNYGPIDRFLIGSVAQAVAAHAPCSVEIVRSRRPASH
jgi:nucleotide-binding universal stress UspA family protein